MPRMIVVALLLGGCTAARSTYFLADATRAYHDAVQAGAEEHAPYEITLAREYLDKAREENGYSDYGTAEKLARRSIQESQRAVQRVTEQEALRTPTDDVPEDRPKEPETPVETSPSPVLDPDE